MSRVIELILLIILAGGAGAAGGFYAAGQMDREMDTPVAVVDVKQFIEQAITGPKGELKDDQVSVGIQQAMETAQILADRGFIVLDRQIVLAAPEKYHVAPPTEASEKEIVKGEKE